MVPMAVHLCSPPGPSLALEIPVRKLTCETGREGSTREGNSAGSSGAQTEPAAGVCPRHPCAAALKVVLAARDTSAATRVLCGPHSAGRAATLCPELMSHERWPGCKAPPNSAPHTPLHQPAKPSIVPLWTGLHTSALLYTSTLN